MLAWLDALTLPQLLGLLAALNLMMYLASWGGVAMLRALLPERDLNQAQARISAAEVGLSLGVVALNIGIAAPGWWLWKGGWIELREGGGLALVLDSALLLLYFDLGMYLLHRLAHLPRLYALIHQRHHLQVDVSGLSLYVMHPAEALGFGALLLTFLLLHPTHLGALAIFLTLNWLYGTVGHSGLALPHPALRWIAGDATFHHDHHRLGRGNYGFFTPLWDHLLGTRLRPREGAAPPGR